MHIQLSPMTFTKSSAQKVGPPLAKNNQVNEHLGPPQGLFNGIPPGLARRYPVYLLRSKQRLKTLYRVFQMSKSRL